MTERRYPASEAARDLLRRGALLSVYASRDGALVEVAADGIPAGHGFRGAGLDSRSLDPGRLFVALPGDRVDGRGFIGGALAAGHWVLAGCEGGRDVAGEVAGLPAPAGTGVLVCTEGTAGLGCLGAAWRDRWPGRMIGITGTNGKTTTKDFCSALLRGAGRVLATTGNLNNQLGVPLTLLALEAQHDFAVVEMGASGVGDIAALAALARPEIGIITNASPAHLARFGSLDGIIQGKGELLDVLPEHGCAVLNADSPGYRRWRDRARCPVVSWGERAGDRRWTALAGAGGEWILDLDHGRWDVPLPGRHNAANLAAAIVAAEALDLPEAELRRGLATFRGSAHRGVRLDWEGRTLIDDSYNANPRSMVAAVQALLDLPCRGRRFAVLGAMAELGEDSPRIHREIGRELAGTGLDGLVVVGPGARGLGEGFDGGGRSHHYCATCAEAAAWIAGETRPGDCLLLKGSRSAAMETIIPSLPRRGDS
ncbi:MAG: UDP-N-acetylmuramoyl-tripeptide--D-alanyl-D-alanine ligase [Candidatus Krumholzibacteriia bacterium]